LKQQLFHIYIRVDNLGNLVNRPVGVDQVGHEIFSCWFLEFLLLQVSSWFSCSWYGSIFETT